MWSIFCAQNIFVPSETLLRKVRWSAVALYPFQLQYDLINNKCQLKNFGNQINGYQNGRLFSKIFFSFFLNKEKTNKKLL